MSEEFVYFTETLKHNNWYPLSGPFKSGKEGWDAFDNIKEPGTYRLIQIVTLDVGVKTIIEQVSDE